MKELVETIAEVVWITNPEKTQTIYINPAYERVFGRSCETAYASPRDWMEAIDPEDRERVIAHSLPGPAQAVGELTYRIIRPDGSRRWIRNKSAKIRDASGRVVRIAGIATDITDHHDLELQLQHAQRMESLGRLAGGVAHDFNNILAVVAANSSMLGTMLPAHSEASEMLGEIESAVKRAVGLTRQLLAFSRKQLAEPVVLDVNAIVVETCKMLRRMIGEDLELETSLEPELCHIKMDPGHLVQVLMNLAVNARDAMPNCGKLTIRTRNHDSGSCVLTVSDTGSGMSAETRARAFEPFFTTKGEGKGTGMGLAVVHGIIQQAGGRIELDTAPGAGTSFHILLPATVERPSRTTIAPPLRSSSGAETVLIVDDDPHILRSMSRVLRGCGYHTLEASNAQSALTAIERNPVDLLLTDVVMPGMNGRELAETALLAHPSLKILYASGYTDDEVLARGISRGAVDIIEKPFSRDALAARVRASLDRTATSKDIKCES